MFSNELSGSDFNPKTRIGSSPVILCTLAMLSNPALTNNGVFQHCPVERLVVDEASQIDTFEFMVSLLFAHAATQGCSYSHNTASLPCVYEITEDVLIRRPEAAYDVSLVMMQLTCRDRLALMQCPRTARRPPP